MDLWEGHAATVRARGKMRPEAARSLCGALALALPSGDSLSFCSLRRSDCWAVVSESSHSPHIHGDLLGCFQWDGDPCPSDDCCRLVRQRTYASIGGYVSSWALLGRAAAPLAVSLVYHQAHSYAPALLMLAGLLTVSCVLILYAERLRRA